MQVPSCRPPKRRTLRKLLSALRSLTQQRSPSPPCAAPGLTASWLPQTPGTSSKGAGGAGGSLPLPPPPGGGHGGHGGQLHAIETLLV